MSDEQQEPDEEAATDDEVAPLTRDALDGGPARLPLILLVVAALIVGFVGGRLTAPDDDDSGEATGGGGTEEDGLPFPSGDQNRTGYWGFAGLEPTVIDTFDRSDAPNDLGETGTGQPWEAVSGTWGIEEDRAVTGGGSEQAPNMAVVADGTGDGLTEVTMMVVEEGAGLVFRYLDPDNYWAVTANPGVGSWSLTRVIDGQAEVVGEAAGPTNDGVTVSVTQDGSIVRLLLEGDEYLSVTDAALGEQLQGGIIASPSTTGEARWDRFLVMRFRPADGAPATTAPA